MERKVFQMEKNGKKVDMMPIMDDLSIYTNGMTLKEQIDNIRRAIRVGELFLGAYENADKLLEKYPNGSELLEGTYALVTDIDAFYIYDTDTKIWKAVIGSTSGILQLNGLTGTNGVLTITGGDINAVVPSSNVVDQTISQHLEYLASGYNDLKDAEYNTPVLFGNIKQESDAYVMQISANADLKGKLTLAIVRYSYTITAGETFNPSKKMKFKITYSDGSIEEGIISGKYPSTQLTRGQFKLDINSYHLAYFYNGANCSFINLATNEMIVKKYNLTSWYTNASGGYFTNLTIYGASDLNVLGFVKKDGNNRKSAILDYEYTIGTENIILTIYSDETFNGEVVIAI
jgi:hypothetical protein